MRTVRYQVVNKNTKKVEYINCKSHKCFEYIAKQNNSNDYIVTHKWLSI